VYDNLIRYKYKSILDELDELDELEEE